MANATKLRMSSASLASAAVSEGAVLAALDDLGVDAAEGATAVSRELLASSSAFCEEGAPHAVSTISAIAISPRRAALVTSVPCYPLAPGASPLDALSSGSVVTPEPDFRHARPGAAAWSGVSPQRGM